MGNGDPTEPSARSSEAIRTPPNFLFKNVHEHILIFAKPNGQRTKGLKVVNYEEIMQSPPKSVRRKEAE